MSSDSSPAAPVASSKMLQANTSSKNTLATSKSTWAHFVAGGTGGTVAAFATCPLEVIKTRLQSLHKTHSIYNIDSHKFGTRIVHAFVDIWTNEGIRGLWKGLGPNLFGVAPSRAIHFATYSWAKKFFVNDLGFKEGNSGIHLLSAILAGVTVHTVTSPIWLVKTRMQLQVNQSATLIKPYKNSIDCAMRVLREEGISGFYRGLVASYAGVAESAIQFVLYEKLKMMIQTQKFKVSHPSLDLSNQLTFKKSESEIRATQLFTMEYLGAASLAKLIASALTYPHEVVRTRMREQRGKQAENKYKGLIQALQLISREEGIKGLYGGMGAHMLRTIPNAAIMFLTYETVLLLFDKTSKT